MVDIEEGEVDREVIMADVVGIEAGADEAGEGEEAELGARRTGRFKED